MRRPIVNCNHMALLLMISINDIIYCRFVVLLHNTGHIVLCSIHREEGKGELQSGVTCKDLSAMILFPNFDSREKTAPTFAASSESSESEHTIHDLLPDRVSEVHFLNDKCVCGVTAEGTLRIVDVSHVDIEGERVYTNEMKRDEEMSMLSVGKWRFSCGSVDALPPSLGLCSSCSVVMPLANNGTSGSDDSLQSSGKIARIAILRAIDAFTCQVFTMTLVTPQRALQTKIQERSFKSAKELASRMSVDVDIVNKAECQYYLGDGDGKNVSVENRQPCLFSNITYLKQVKSLAWVLEYVHKYTISRCQESDIVMFQLIMVEGIMRTQPLADYLNKSRHLLNGSSNGDTKQDLDVSNFLLQYISSSRDMNNNRSIPSDHSLCDIVRVIAFRKLFIEKLKRVTLYRHMITFSKIWMNDSQNSPQWNAWCELASKDKLKSCAGKGKAERQLYIMWSVCMESNIYSIAVFLARWGSIKQLYVVTQLYRKELLPRLLDLLREVSVFISPLEYYHMLPLPTEFNDSRVEGSVLCMCDPSVVRDSDSKKDENDAHNNYDDLAVSFTIQPVARIDPDLIIKTVKTVTDRSISSLDEIGDITNWWMTLYDSDITEAKAIIKTLQYHSVEVHDILETHFDLRAVNQNYLTYKPEDFSFITLYKWYLAKIE